MYRNGIIPLCMVRLTSQGVRGFDLSPVIHLIMHTLLSPISGDFCFWAAWYNLSMKILIDIGGTNTRVAASSDGLSFSTPVIVETSRSYVNGVAGIASAAHTLAGGADIKAVAVGFKSVISSDGRVPLMAPQGLLEDWKGKPLADDLEKALGGRTTIVNDTALVGLGEAVYGAGQGASIVAYITVSTGVNGVRITAGEIDRTAQGFETGKQYMSTADSAKSLEDLISGAAIEKRFGKHPKEIAQDDPLWEELAGVLAYGVYTTMLYWSPNRIVIGGSMMNEIGISIDRVRAHVEKINKAYPTLPEIVHSSLGDLGGLWGGLALR